MRTRWIGIAALVALVGLIAAGAWLTGRPRPRPVAAVSPSDESITQALRQARGDSAARPAAGDTVDKSRWMPEVKGFDVSGLRPERRAMFVRFANAQRCTCGCGYTLAGCRSYDPTCPVSGPRVEKLLDSVRTGRYSSGTPAMARP